MREVGRGMFGRCCVYSSEMFINAVIFSLDKGYKLVYELFILMKRSIVKSFVWLFLSCSFVGNNYALWKKPRVGEGKKAQGEVKPAKQGSIEKKPVVVSMPKTQIQKVSEKIVFAPKTERREVIKQKEVVKTKRKVDVAKTKEFLNKTIRELSCHKKNVQKQNCSKYEKIFLVKLCRCCKVGIDFIRNDIDAECLKKLAMEINQLDREVVGLMKCVEDGKESVAQGGVDQGYEIKFKQLLQDLSVQGILGELESIEKSYQEYKGFDYVMDRFAEFAYVLLMTMHENIKVQEKAKALLYVMNKFGE